jgi:hypothetical protein
VFVIRSILVMTAVSDTVTVKVRRTKRVTVVLHMELASMDCARAPTDGEEPTAATVALEMASVAAETGSALKETVIATLVGLGSDAISALACMIAHNTDIAITEPVCARRATVAVTALFHRSLNHANVPSIVFVDASNSAPRFMRLRVLVLHTNATPSAHRSVFLNVLPARCL